jgi:hypothetical protein
MVLPGSFLLILADMTGLIDISSQRGKPGKMVMDSLRHFVPDKGLLS